MATQQITSANVSQAIVKQVATMVAPALVGSLVMGNLVNRDYEAVLARTGDTVNVPIAPQMTANNIAEGGTVQLQNPQLGNAQIVLNTHLEASFQIGDVVKALAQPDLFASLSDSAVKGLAERVETDLLQQYAGFTYNAAVGTYNTAPTEAIVDSAESALFKAKCPPGMQKFLVGSADFVSAIRQIPRFTEYQKLGDAEKSMGAIANGAIVGKLKDFTVLRSQLVSITSSTNTHNLAFGRDAIMMAVRRLDQPLPGTGAVAYYMDFGNFGFRVIMSYQPGQLGHQFTIDILYGTAILRNAFGLEVKS